MHIHCAPIIASFCTLVLCGGLASQPLNIAPSPFEAKPKINMAGHPAARFVKRISAEPEAQFTPSKLTNIPVPTGTMPEWPRIRIGTVQFGSGVRFHVECAEAPAAPPSRIEFVEPDGQRVAASFPVLQCSGLEMYFTGTGMAYIWHEHPELCGPKYMRKLVLRSKKILEAAQALEYIGTETRLEREVTLFDSPTGSVPIATLSTDTAVHVVGVSPLHRNQDLALLIRTPLGITGWHKAYRNTGILDITQCR